MKVGSLFFECSIMRAVRCWAGLPRDQGARSMQKLAHTHGFWMEGDLGLTATNCSNKSGFEMAICRFSLPVSL